ncbi:MAG: hypothetical protein HC897_00195 [Thermoanaerobaculia bacterium]|nr:hypothetical protein [Thermoanaerobaculia bacterium]
MRRRNTQSGEGRLGCIFWIVMLVIGGMVASRVVPPKIATAELKDHMEDLAATRPRGTNEDFRNSIYKRAQELKLPVQQKEISVQKDTQRAVMDVEFTIPVDLFVYTWMWKVSLHVDRPIFIV